MSMARYGQLSFCPSFSVARIASASEKTMAPSFNPCDDHRTSDG